MGEPTLVAKNDGSCDSSTLGGCLLAKLINFFPRTPLADPLAALEPLMVAGPGPGAAQVFLVFFKGFCTGGV